MQDTTPTNSFVRRNNKGLEALEEEIKALEAAATTPEDMEEVEEVEEIKKPQESEKEEGLSSEEKSFKKRYGDLRRYQQKEKQELQAKIDALEAKLEQASSDPQLPKTKEQVEAWVKKYPDVAAIVKSLAGQEASQKAQELDKRLKEIEDMGAQIALEKAEAEIRKIHPDFDEIRESDDFHTWAEDQPASITKPLYDDLDVRGAARAIDLYKLDRGIKKTSPDKNAALSVSTRSRANTPVTDESSKWWSESRVSRMTDKEYMEKESEILEAMRDGKFKYDISKKAR